MESNLSAEEIFSLWAPNNSPWSDWVKPALFVSFTKNLSNSAFNKSELPNVDWVKSVDKKSVLFLDLPNEQSILEGLALIQYGYQPIPLFNCCSAPGMVVDVAPILNALEMGANFLKSNPISKNATPVFLLDSNRLSGKDLLIPGKFDNRWCVVPQDLPSALKLIPYSFENVLICTGNLQNDISHVLKRYQVDGLKIKHRNTNTNNVLDFIMPSNIMFRNVWYRLKVLAGLSRNAAGGFGGVIPMPSASGHG